MKKTPLLKWKIAASLVFQALLTFANSASAALVVTGAYQNPGTSSFDPTVTWTVATNSLIHGLSPSSQAGNFTGEANTPGVSALTDGTIGPVSGSLNIYAAGGPSAGTQATYTLPAQTYGYNLTNITVYSGWANGGRSAQGYTVLYSTVANPTTFIYLTNVTYTAGFSGNNPGTPITLRVQLADSAGGVIAANVSQVEFLFSWPTAPNGENSGSGYSEITVQGTPAASVVAPMVSITTSNQSGSSPFTPTWTAETPDLILGMTPSTASGTFTLETSGGTPVLTDGTVGTSGTHSTLATCGYNGGTTLIYTLTNVVNGTDVTNIITYSGWGDSGRDGQYYTVSYSTIAAPNAFTPITTVYYLPSFPNPAPANRVAIAMNDGSALASGVAKIKFDFSGLAYASSFNNAYQGYSEIIVQGHDTAAPPPPPSPLLTQDTLPSYAATVVGDQVVFTATYSNFPPVTLQWQQVVSGPVTNNISTGVVNITNNNVVTSTLTLNNVQTNSSGTYRLQGLNATNGAAAPSYSSGASLVVSSPPTAVGNIIFNTAEQLSLGALSPVNASTNFTPTWIVDTANDLINGFLTNASPSVPGTSYPGVGNFNLPSPNAPCNPDPTILSDASGGYISYWPNIGGNLTECSCGVGGTTSSAGDTMTYTLPSSAPYGFDVTNITVYGGWGDAGRNEQKYEVLYSTVANPTLFTSLGTFDYNPTDPANLPTATRTMLVPVSGKLAQNVYAVEINWNVASAPKNNWEGYSEIVVQGVQSLNYPILVQDTLPATAATVVGDQISFTATYSNAPAANLQWQYISTNGVVSDIAGATTVTLALNNLQLTNTGSYRLKAVSIADSTAITYSTAAPLGVTAAPAPVGNIIITTANQTFLGAVSGVNLSTNYTPTWTENTNNDLILNSVDGSVGTPGTVYGNPGTVGFAPLNSNCNGDPVILSDGSPGYLNYWPGIGGNSTLDACGNSAGFSVTYTLPASSSTGWSLTNITVYGGWGSNGRDELKYEVLYSTISAPTTFNHLVNVDYNPAGGSPNLPSASRTMLVPAAGAMAQNVYAVELNFFNAASGSENGWSGYSEIVVAGKASPPVPVLTTNVTPTTAEDVVGSSLILMANFSGADSFQWLKNGTNLPGATSPTLTLNNLQLSDMATNSGYSLVASNGAGTNMTTFCKVFVDQAPAAVSNIVTAIAYQTSTTAGFTPTWDTTMLGFSLIAGEYPPIIAYDPTGNFNDPDTGIQANNLAGGLPVLTDGGYGAFDNTGAHPAFATCGPGGPAPGAGQYVIYQLGNFSPDPNGYTITNIQIAGGWNDNGRNSQYYTVSYSTVANPTMFFPMIVQANNLSSGNAIGGGNSEAVPSGAGIPTTVRTTFTPASGVLASNVYAIYIDYTVPTGVPNAYSGYSEISVFGSPSAAPIAGPVITTQHEEYTDSFTLETPNLIANQLPSSYGPGVFTEEGCSEAGLTDGVLAFGGNTNSASCGDDGIAVPWIVFTPTNGSWNLTNIVVYTLWHDYGRDGQFYNVSYSTLSNPTTFLPLASVAYNPFVVHDGRASGNRVAIAPPLGQDMLATNVAAVKFDFTSQGIQDFGWSGYTEIVLQGTNAPSTIVTAPILGAPTVSGGNLILTGTGGTPGAAYTWLTTTNLAAPILWTTNTTGNLDGSGGFTNSIPIGANPGKFFRLRLP